MNYMKPNIERLITALNHEKGDRVPNFEILFDDRATSYFLNKQSESFWKVKPEDAVKICNLTGQDALVCSLDPFIFDEGSILKPEDINNKLSYHDKSMMVEKLNSYIKAIEGTNIGICIRIGGPLTLTYMSTGPIPIQSFMLLIYDKPELINMLLDVYTDKTIEILEAIKNMNFHLFYIGDDLSDTKSTLFSPNFLDSVWAKRYKKIIDAMKDTGKPIINHCCGKQDYILPKLVEWGVNATHPVQPIANNIDKVYEDYGKSLTLIGNIDITKVLTYGNKDDIIKETKSYIDRFAGNGNYVVCSSHSIINSVPPENYLVMARTVAEYGVFDR
jgi:uroporphyrinogen-III decarboxylase